MLKNPRKNPPNPLNCSHQQWYNTDCKENDNCNQQNYHLCTLLAGGFLHPCVSIQTVLTNKSNNY